MKTLKNGNLAKLVAFFLIAISLTAVIAISAGGWLENDKTEPDSGNIEDENQSSSDNADENTDGDKIENDTPVVAPKPSYTHYLTGLKISESDYLIKPYAIVLDPQAPQYGISSSMLTVEIPIENGETRYLMLTNDASSLGKLGSIAAARKYINSIASYLGGVLVSYGEDDYFKYDVTAGDIPHIDFKENSGYSYSEFGKYVYTNADLVSAYIKNNNINIISKQNGTAPYLPIQGTRLSGDSSSKILISYSSTNTTEFSYSSEDNAYYMTKNGSDVKDLLNDKRTSYTNLFILYADSTTHETAEATQLIMDTTAGGKGKCFSGGAFIDIKWTLDDNGNLLFTTMSGDKITVNAGSSYIGFVKASRTDDVIYE